MDLFEGAEAVKDVMNVTLEQRSLIFTCPALKADGQKCGDCWDYLVVRDVACLTTPEKQSTEKKMNEIDKTCSAKAQACPKCGIFCVNLQRRKRAKCGSCQFEFCWSCQRKWHNTGGDKQCGNDTCTGVDPRLKYLKEKTKKKVMEYTCLEAYDTRACPGCGFIIHHNGGCKQTKCPSCQIDFCFVCLSVYNTQTKKWPCGRYNVKCEIAPIQTKIPEKK